MKERVVFSVAFCSLAIALITLLSKNYQTNLMIEKEFQSVRKHVEKVLQMAGSRTKYIYVPSNSNQTEHKLVQKPKCKQDFSVYSMDQTSWKWNGNLCGTCTTYLTTTLTTPYGTTPIMVYPANIDPWMSGLLLGEGIFEADKSAVLFDLLSSNRNLNFIDLGANIGVFTLSAAKMGRRVIAVEALDENLRHMCASVAAGKFREKVTLVHNAISNKKGVVKLGIDKNNMGGTFVDEEASHIKKMKAGRVEGIYGTVNSITMDDLLKIPEMENFSQVVLKMSIEGFEAKALEGAKMFFKKVRVAAIMMEWEFHRGQESARSIIKAMIKLNFEPHTMNVLKPVLSFKNYDSWGYDILWLPKLEA